MFFWLEKKERQVPRNQPFTVIFSQKLYQKPITQYKLMRIKLIILASLQHQITSHASHSGVGPHERLLTRWEEPTVSWDHFASPAAALECSDLQSPGLAHIDPDILI